MHTDNILNAIMVKNHFQMEENLRKPAAAWLTAAEHAASTVSQAAGSLNKAGRIILGTKFLSSMVRLTGLNFFLN